MALPPQYQQKILKVYALQYDGTNNAEMLNFAPAFLYETPEGVLMQKRSYNISQYSVPIAVGEWIIQWSNTVNRGVFERVPDSTFGLTWGLVP